MGHQTADAIREDLRLQRAAVRLSALPPRLSFELLREIGVRHGVLQELVDLAERYAAVDPQLLAALGGDRFPATRLHVVP